MRNWIALAALLVTPALPASAAPPTLSPAQLERLRQAGGEILFWNDAQRAKNFAAMETLFPVDTVATGPRVRPLPKGRALELPQLDVRMADARMTGLIVLKDGKRVLEQYAGALTPTGRWTSFSVAKSFTSTLVGAAVRDGLIKSLDDAVTTYLPELKGSGYDGVTVRQILTMTSGVRWNEDYTNPNSDVARMYAKAAPAGVDPTLAYLRTLSSEARPGTKWVYKTGETNLIGVLVTRVTGKSLAAYLSEKVWKPYGMAQPAAWMMDASGQDIGGCCLSVSLTDYARFGQFILEGGHGVLPADWLPAATGPTVPITASGGRPSRGGYYGYQWWTAPDHFDALGIFGQQVRIDPKRRLVIAITSNWPSAVNAGYEAKRAALIKDIERAVDAR